MKEPAETGANVLYTAKTTTATSEEEPSTPPLRGSDALPRSGVDCVM